MKSFIIIFLLVLLTVSLHAQNMSVYGGNIPSLSKTDKLYTEGDHKIMGEEALMVYKVFPNYQYKPSEIEGYLFTGGKLTKTSSSAIKYLLKSSEEYGTYSAVWKNDTVVMIDLAGKDNHIVRQIQLLATPAGSDQSTLIKDTTDPAEMNAEREKFWKGMAKSNSNSVKTVSEPVKSK